LDKKLSDRESRDRAKSVQYREIAVGPLTTTKHRSPRAGPEHHVSSTGAENMSLIDRPDGNRRFHQEPSIPA
jgi:hypothetical protein